MFWNETKKWMASVCHRKSIRRVIEDEFSNLNRKLDMIFEIVNESQDFHIANHTIDKFDDYMKNVDKLNTMINEFKGCVSLARGAIAEGKELIKEVDGLKGLHNTSKEIYKAMQSFVKAFEKMKHEAYYKVDFIYKKVEEISKKLQKKDKNSCKTIKRKIK